MDYTTISFYNYFPLENPEEFKQGLEELCKKLSLLGRILIGKEGINTALSGTTANIKTFKQFILAKFPDLTFREQTYEKNSYHKLVVRVRKEIVAFGKEVDPTLAGKVISPQELKNALDKKEDITLIDARNNYEFAVGKFTNAVSLDINTFREFPNASKKLHSLKNKKIILYCTGGIRCEKASAYLKQEGFTDVYQLQGGIINYINQFNDHFEGSCFVFDDRLITGNGKAITTCQHCATESSSYLNCHNLDCDKLFISCSSCREKMNSTCSLTCKEAPRQRILKKEVIVLGKIVNYYPKIQVALITVEKNISKEMTLSILGKTTKLFNQPIAELRNNTGNIISTAQSGEIITIPISSRVRKNDLVVLA